MERKVYIQILNVLSCFAVVTLHVNECYWDFSYARYWLTANVIESVMYFAVPVFFMISGATLINYRSRYSTVDFFKKRILKTVIPFILWSFVGILFLHFNDGMAFDGIHQMVGKIANANYITFYWFFPALFAVYLAIPFLSYIPEGLPRKKAFGYAIIAAFTFNSLLPFIFTLFHIQFNETLQMPAIAGYLLYVLLGYWISTYALSKKQRMVIYIAAVLGLLANLIGTWYLSYQAGTLIQTYQGYHNVTCILYSVGIFTFVKNLHKKRIIDLLNKLTAPFSKLTFGIYLTHWFVLKVITTHTKIPTAGTLYRIIGSVAVFLICAGIVKILQFIPFLKKAVP